ncbi:MAG: hypothetical protein LC792_04990 [Actinobacteria bacterium]|nr:hypothetical protein [Actinomycetota bacterium]
MAVFLGLGLAGAVGLVGSLVWDALVHAGQPGLAAHESVLTLTNPAHVCFLAGLVAVVTGLLGSAWTALGGRSGSRWARGGLVAVALAMVVASAAAAVRADQLDRASAGVGSAGASGHADHGAAAAGASPPPHHQTADCRPTTGQRAAADRLVDQTRTGTARFASLDAAEADGYRPVTPPSKTLVHYLNPSYTDDGQVLDPGHPEVLIYANTRTGPVLAAAMYLADRVGQEGPAVGGCLTTWHAHTDLCFSVQSLQVESFSADGTCPAGQVHYQPPPMMHVWLVDVPGGPFAPDADGAALSHRLGG